MFNRRRQGDEQRLDMPGNQVNHGRPAAAINEALLRRGVIVRPIGNYGLPNHLRVSIGLEPENARFIVELADLLA